MLRPPPLCCQPPRPWRFTISAVACGTAGGAPLGGAAGTDPRVWGGGPGPSPLPLRLQAGLFGSCFDAALLMGLFAAHTTAGWGCLPRPSPLRFPRAGLARHVLRHMVRQPVELVPTRPPTCLRCKAPLPSVLGCACGGGGSARPSPAVRRSGSGVCVGCYVWPFCGLRVLCVWCALELRATGPHSRGPRTG